MAHKLDCTEKAWQIMMEKTTFKKPMRMTPKRQRYINDTWPRWKKYRQALIDADLYKGCAWSADRKWPTVDIDTKEKFTINLLTNHCLSHQFHVTFENAR